MRWRSTVNPEEKRSPDESERADSNQSMLSRRGDLPVWFIRSKQPQTNSEKHQSTWCLINSMHQTREHTYMWRLICCWAQWNASKCSWACNLFKVFWLLKIFLLLNPFTFSVFVLVGRTIQSIHSWWEVKLGKQESKVEAVKRKLPEDVVRSPRSLFTTLNLTLCPDVDLRWPLTAVHGSAWPPESTAGTKINLRAVSEVPIRIKSSTRPLFLCLQLFSTSADYVKQN